MQFESRSVKAFITYANSAALMLGLALAAWGFAPAIIERIVTHESPSGETLAVGAVSVLIGAMYMLLAGLIRRRSYWALWAALVMSLILVVGWFATALFDFNSFLSTFLLVLAGIVAIASWMALQAIARQKRSAAALFEQPQTPDATQ